VPGERSSSGRPLDPREAISRVAQGTEPRPNRSRACNDFAAKTFAGLAANVDSGVVRVRLRVQARLRALQIAAARRSRQPHALQVVRVCCRQLQPTNLDSQIPRSLVRAQHGPWERPLVAFPWVGSSVLWISESMLRKSEDQNRSQRAEGRHGRLGQCCSYVQAGLVLRVLKTTRASCRLRQRIALRRLFPSACLRSR
jgi:hypothetical protein